MKITYDDKMQPKNTARSKVSIVDPEDFDEIKAVVNANDDKLDDLYNTGGVLAQFNLEFDISTSSTLDIKKVKYNNPDPVLVTEIYMSETSFDDKDLAQYISRLKVDDVLIMQQSDDAATFTTYAVSGDPTEDIGMWTVPVISGNDVGTLPTNQKEVSMNFVYFPSTEAHIQSIASDLLVNGNLSINDFDNIRNFDDNTTEYYGVELILQTGVYTTVEIPYKNRVSTTDPAYLYAIILDQNNTTLAYTRLDVGLSAITEGSFILDFDAPITISTSGIYQLVIGRREWDLTTRICEVFSKSITSSSGGVWTASTIGSNASLANDDTSLVDWSTITKQNFNIIHKAIIYKS